MTIIPYYAAMSRWSHTVLLLLSLLALLGGGASAAEVSLPAEPAVASEFCGAGKAPVELRCPKTSALKCYCSMSAKEAPVAFQLEASVQAVTRVRLPKAVRRVRLLPETVWSYSLLTHVEAVPTPPPRL